MPRLLVEFERKYLARWTPCNRLSDDELVQAIAETHVEVHPDSPFPRGNGRLSRLLADVMAVQAGACSAELHSWGNRKTAIHRKSDPRGFSGNYSPMRACVQQALKTGDSGSDEISGPA